MKTRAAVNANRSSKAALSVATLVIWFALYTYPSYLMPFLTSLGASASLAGIVIGSYGLAMLVCRIPLGIWADKVGRRKPFVIAGSALAAISALGMGLAQSPVMVFIFRILSGVGISTWVCFTVLYNSCFAPQESEKALANINILSSAGRLAAGFAGAFAASAIGVRGAFYVAAAFGIIGVISSFFVKEQVVKREPMRFRALLRVMKEPGLLFAGLVAAGFYLLANGTGMSFVSILAVKVGASDFQIGMLGTVNALGSTLGLWLCSRLFLKFLSEKAVILCATICTMLGCVLFPHAGSVRTIYLLQAFVGLTSGGLNSLFMTMSIRHIQPEKQATAMGAYQALYSIGILLGPVVMGGFVDVLGTTNAFYAVTVFGVVCIAATLLFYNRTQKTN